MFTGMSRFPQLHWRLQLPVAQLKQVWCMVYGVWCMVYGVFIFSMWRLITYKICIHNDTESGKDSDLDYRDIGCVEQYFF